MRARTLLAGKPGGRDWRGAGFGVRGILKGAPRAWRRPASGRTPGRLAGAARRRPRGSPPTPDGAKSGRGCLGGRGNAPAKGQAGAARFRHIAEIGGRPALFVEIGRVRDLTHLAHGKEWCVRARTLRLLQSGERFDKKIATAAWVESSFHCG